MHMPIAGATTLVDLGPAIPVTSPISVRCHRMSRSSRVRTAFVLHDVFDVPFGDIAEVVGRTPEAVRQLDSRARRHVTRGSPRFAASRDEHDRTVRAFAQAAAEGNLEGLIAVLDPDVVWTSDCGGRGA
jgi:hypothetical protein